jgi:hypothetical protein
MIVTTSNKNLIYNYKRGVRACVCAPRGVSVCPSGILLARIITNLVELRVMGITQCQGYPIGWNSE